MKSGKSLFYFEIAFSIIFATYVFYNTNNNIEVFILFFAILFAIFIRYLIERIEDKGYTASADTGWGGLAYNIRYSVRILNMTTMYAIVVAILIVFQIFPISNDVISIESDDYTYIEIYSIFERYLISSGYKYEITGGELVGVLLFFHIFLYYMFTLAALYFIHDLILHISHLGRLLSVKVNFIPITITTIIMFVVSLFLYRVIFENAGYYVNDLGMYFVYLLAHVGFFFSVLVVVSNVSSIASILAVKIRG